MRIAVTGGIGSGKSEVMRIIHSLGYNCYSSDEINSKLLLEPQYISKIQSLFPTAVNMGAIDRRELANIVFSSKEKLAQLNSIAHPLIRQLSMKLSSGSGLNFVEVPLLFECGFESDYDKIILVTADINTRVDRASKRDKKSKDDIIKVVSNQIKSYEGKKIDYIITNNDGLYELEQEVQRIIDLISEN